MAAEPGSGPIAAELVALSPARWRHPRRRFSNDSRSEARDRSDALARAAGWQVPGWYTELKATAVPILGSHTAMVAAARAARLDAAHAEERPVDVGITDPAQLVRYRLGQPPFGIAQPTTRISGGSGHPGMADRPTKVAPILGVTRPEAAPTTHHLL